MLRLNRYGDGCQITVVEQDVVLECIFINNSEIMQLVSYFEDEPTFLGVPLAYIDTKIQECMDAGNSGQGVQYVSDFSAMKSNAGWYGGTWCIEEIDGKFMPVPFSRETDYFADKKTCVLYVESHDECY